MAQSLAETKRIVVKIGSSLLVDETSGQIHQTWLARLVEDLVFYWKRGKDIVIVSSGAIALGRSQLNLKKPKLQLQEKQAAAAIGQIKLAHAYQTLLAQHTITAAQVLMTLEDSENRQRYLNAKNTLETLLEQKIIPIINENDTIATSEIRYGDNDRLAARVSQMIAADTLVLLSDIEGLYTSNPHLNPAAELIPEVKQLTPEIFAMAGDSSTNYGSGGMITKLAAAEMALAFGCRMVIAAGKHLNPLQRIDQVRTKTWFIPQTTPMNARKNWIAQHLSPKGCLVIDQGAENALLQGKSLLSVGVVMIEGIFHKGDAINILNEKREEIARGLINYSSAEAQKILGKQSDQIEQILGYFNSAEIIHRNDLVIYKR